MNDQTTHRSQFREAIQNSVRRMLAVTSSDLEMPDNEAGSGAGFLNAFSREIGLNEGDYFTAYFFLAKGAIGDDTTAVLEMVKDFWTELFARLSSRPTGIQALLDQDEEFRGFLDRFMEIAGLNPYDYATARTMLDSGSDHQALIAEVQQLWQTIFDHEEQTSPNDIDLTSPTSLIARVSATPFPGGLAH